MAKKRLGELLLEIGLLDEEGLARALGGAALEAGKARGGDRKPRAGHGTGDRPGPLRATRHPHDRPEEHPRRAPGDRAHPGKGRPETPHHPHRDRPPRPAHRDGRPVELRGVRGRPVRLRLHHQAVHRPRSDILWAIDQHYHLGSSLSTIVKDIVDERQVELWSRLPGTRGEGPRRPAEEVRGRPRHPDGEPDRRRGGRAGGLRHPRGADEDGPPDPSPGRRAPAQDDGSSEVGPGGGRLADQDHGEHGHRRETAPAGRQDRRPRGGAQPRPAGLHGPGELRGESGHPDPRLRQREHPAGVDRVFPRGNGEDGGDHLPSAGDRPHHGTHRIGKDDHPLRDPEPDQIRRGQHHDDRRPDRVRTGGDQPGGGAGEDRPHLRRHAPVDAAAGPRHHHGGGDARPGYDHDRRSGGPHGAPGALHDPHQLLRGDDHPASRPRGTLLSDRLHDRRNRGAAPGPQDLPRNAR